MTASRERGANQPPYRFDVDLSEAYERHAGLPLRQRQARAYADALRSLPVYLLPDDGLVGMVYHCGERKACANPTAWQDTAEDQVRRLLPENSELVDLQLCSDGSIPGHVSWRWDWILSKGVLGLMDDCRRLLSSARDEKAKEFYECVIILLRALLEWNDEHVSALEESLNGAEPADCERLRELISICRRVPAYPARTFREAVQSFYFQHIAVMSENPFGGNSPGRLDYFLWPYLESDLASGTCTLEDARELIDELFVKLHERILSNDAHVEAIVVGGCHPDGSSAVNPLSYMMVESIMSLDQLHPSVYMRIPEDAPEDFIELASRYLIEGRNRAQILSDPAIMKAMQCFGMTREDASMYTCGGCMEIAPQGMNSDLLFSGFHNVPKTVEMVLTGGECLRTGQRLGSVSLPALPDYATFDELYDAFSAELERELNVLFRRLDLYSAAMAERRPVFLLSCMTEDCLKRGRELHDGGARYHDYGIGPLGIPNAGDALFSVKRAVFEDRICSASELLSALRSDFSGHEELRLRLRSLPKYGQQDAEADEMTDRVLKTVCTIFREHRNRWDGMVKPVVLTFVWGPVAGAALGATADGNHAGTPIAQSLTPQSYAMSHGITAAIGSHAALSLDLVSGGASSMWDISPEWATTETVGTILRTFIELGGHIFQGNTTDVAELIRAREHPEDHPGLMVRVGGFSARFVTLDEALQKEIITRRRHSS